LQQRRTQTESFLSVFDTPSIVANCPRRPTTTTPLQSLAQLNSRFARTSAQGLAGWVLAEHPALESAGKDGQLAAPVAALFRRVLAREPLPEERVASIEFLTAQRAEYGPDRAGLLRVWTDFSQMLLASNEFLYVE
jgi:hypothetical protein